MRLIRFVFGMVGGCMYKHVSDYLHRSCLLDTIYKVYTFLLQTSLSKLSITLLRMLLTNSNFSLQSIVITVNVKLIELGTHRLYNTKGGKSKKTFFILIIRKCQ